MFQRSLAFGFSYEFCGCFTGGPIGAEPVFSAYGPLAGIVGFVVWPLVYCVPLALCTAEMSAAFPRSGGFIHWTLAAFGPAVAFVGGFVSWGAGVACNALYPVMFHDVLVQAGFLDKGAGVGHWAVKAAFAIALACIVCRGVKLVGRAMVVVNVLALVPFIAYAIAAFAARGESTAFSGARLRQGPIAHEVPNAARTRTYVSTLFWCFSGVDHMSTFASEVKDPGYTYPRALLLSLALSAGAYVLPLLAAAGDAYSGCDDATGGAAAAAWSGAAAPPATCAASPGGGGGRVPAMETSWPNWEDGSLTRLSRALGGAPMMGVVLVGSGFCVVGLHMTELFEDAFVLLGLAELRMAPAALARRHARFDTPLTALVVGTCVVLVFCAFDFTTVLAASNVLRCAAVLLEFSAIVVLRYRLPRLARPYRVPGPDHWAWVAFLLLPACVACAFVAYLSVADPEEGGTVAALSGGVLLGVALVHVGMRRAGAWRPVRATDAEYKMLLDGDSGGGGGDSSSDAEGGEKEEFDESRAGIEDCLPAGGAGPATPLL